MKIDLSGQTVAVFGAARGIGRAIAEGFAEAGATVHGADRSVDDLTDRLAFDCQPGDVTDQADLTRLADRGGAVDHVVFAVGIGSGQFGFPFWYISPDVWAGVLEVNLIGAARVAHAFAPAMAQRGRGSLLFLTSVAGQIGPEDLPAVKDAGFRCVICNRPDDEQPGQPSADSVKQATEEAGLEFRYIPVVSGHMTDQNAIDQAAALKDLPTPVLAYCRSGTRCANLYALVLEIDG